MWSRFGAVSETWGLAFQRTTVKCVKNKQKGVGT